LIYKKSLVPIHSGQDRIDRLVFYATRRAITHLPTNEGIPSDITLPSKVHSLSANSSHLTACDSL